MTTARFYQTNRLAVQELAGAAADFFRRDGFEAGFHLDYTGRTILQIGKQQGVRYIFGLAYTLSVVMTPQPDDRVLIELGGESWGDKIASGAVGALFLPPLLFTAAYGAWKQSELDDRFFQFMDGYIFNRTGQYANPVMAVPYYNGPVPPSGWNVPAGGLGNVPGANPPPFSSSTPPYPAPAYQAYQNSAYGYAPPGLSQPPYAAPAYPTARTSWFDPANLQPIFEQQVGRMASWQAVMADNVINYAELNHQQERVERLQKQAENLMDTTLRLKLAEVMTELNRLEQLQRTALTQAYRSKPAN